jgi:uncharacterized protein DUF4157
VREPLRARTVRAAVQRREARHGATRTHPLLALQRTRGNRFVARFAEGGGTLTPDVERAIDRSRGAGAALSTEVRAAIEPALGTDLSGVRVHTGAAADGLSRALGARAFTTGRDVFFKSGAYDQSSAAGRELLAHELVHVVQQGDEPVRAKLELGPVDDEHEREADAVARTVVQRWHEPSPVRRACDGCDEETPCAECADHASPVRRQADARERAPPRETCTPRPGIPNDPAHCTAYLRNSWWLPNAYVNNATCACLTTPNAPTANCVRQVLQDRLAATPSSFKRTAAGMKALESTMPAAYEAFVQTVLTPVIYDDHIIAYSSCCCPSGPAAYASWIGVSTVPLPCSTVGWAIRTFGSCHGTPGAW